MGLKKREVSNVDSNLEEPVEDEPVLSLEDINTNAILKRMSHASKASRAASRSSNSRIMNNSTPGKIKPNFVAETLLGGSQAKNVQQSPTSSSKYMPSRSQR